MRIERIDDKTVKCFISNEELKAYNITYRDFILRSEKAKEMVEEIMEKAEIEVGYQPPQFALDLQIMMLPEQGMILVFSEKQLEGSEYKDIMRNQIQNQDEVNKVTKTKATEKKELPSLAMFSFRSMNDIFDYIKVLPKNLRVATSLYTLKEEYILFLEKGSASYKRYSRACIQATEFGTLYGANRQTKRYVEEHGQCLIEEKALQKLSTL